MSHLITDYACTRCGCVCDDLRLLVEDQRIVRAEGACTLAEPWLLGQHLCEMPLAQQAGTPLALPQALEMASELLAHSRAPLLFGLSRSSTEGQRVAVRLADQLGATIDTSASLGHGPSVMAIQEVGESTCTLGEARHRADLVLFWGCDPVQTHPRHLERYSVHARGEWVPRGRADRFVVVADHEPTATSREADLFVPIAPGGHFDALWTLRGLIHDVEPAPGSSTGAPLPLLRDLAERMRRCRWGIVFFGIGLAQSACGHRAVEALLTLTRDLNAHTRFYVRRVRGSGDVAGADSLLAWQTGYAFGVNLARGYPRYNPGEFTAQDMLLRDEVDLCLLVGTQSVARLTAQAREKLSRLPTIVLESPRVEPPFVPTLRFTTAVYGVHLPGTVYRMDEVPVPVKAVLPAQYPSDAFILDQLSEAWAQRKPERVAGRR